MTTRITPGETITHTEQEIAEIAGVNLQNLQDEIDQVSSNLHVVSTSLDQTKVDLTTTQQNLQTAVNDLNAAKTDLQQTQQDLSTAQVDIVELKDDMLNLPKGTTVVTSLPASPAEVDGALVIFLDVLDQELRGLYSWDGTEWINPGKLLDGSVTAEKLSPGIIFSAEIEAGEIKETHIDDNSITTPKIRAGAVTTSKLVVGNFANLCENNDFELGDSSWDKEQGWTIVNEPANSYNGNWIAKRAGNAAASALRNVKFKCVENQKYIAQAHIKRGAGADGNAYVRVTTYNAAGVETVVGAGNPITSSTFTMSEVTVTVPVGAVNIRVEVVATNTTGFIYVDQGVLSINSLTVIEDGSITSAKIAGDAIKANHISAGIIVGSHLAVNNLAALKADMGNITSGTITLDTGGHIKGGQTGYNTGTGFWLGYSGGYKFSMGNSSQGFTWDGSAFNLYGGQISINNKFFVFADGSTVIRSGTSGARLE